MSATRFCAGAMAAAGIWMGAAMPASALSFDEFDAMADHQRESFISTVLHYYYFTYRNDPATRSRAECMTDLELRSTPEGAPYLYDFIERDLVAAGANGRRGQPVEHVIADIIAEACSPT